MIAFIRIKNAQTNTLKNIDLDLPKNHFIVFCGPSGSGKSSMAYDTLFPKGQRCYIQAISPHSKQLIHIPDTALCDSIEGMTPTIATSQRTHWQHQRATVGTLTELSHYLQVLFMHASVPHCPTSGMPLEKQNSDRIVHKIQNILSSTDASYALCSPYVKKRGNLKEELMLSAKKGFNHIRLNGKISSVFYPSPRKISDINQLEVCIDRFCSGHLVSNERLIEDVKKALEFGNGICILVQEETNQEYFFSLDAYSTVTQQSFPKLEEQHFSFNSVQGMCEKCQGLGIIQGWDLDTVIDPTKSIRNHCCLLANEYSSFPNQAIYDALQNQVNLYIDQPWFSLSQKAQKAFLYGHPSLNVSFEHPVHRKKWEETIDWEGIFVQAWNRYQPTKKGKNKWAPFLTEWICPTCNGSRLKPYPSAARLKNKIFADLNRMSVSDLFDFFSSSDWKDPLWVHLEGLLDQVQQRLHFLVAIGLDYLTLGQSARSLSGGELQRCRLAGQVGSGLSGMTYIFDEPSIGLHPQDVHKLIYGFHRLRDQKNTVIVVEHDETTILSADHVVEFGPEGGEKGGTIVFQGTPSQLLTEGSSTGKYLKSQPVKSSFRPPKSWISLEGVSKRNIFSLDLTFPTGVLLALAGVSGSGKSTLIHDILTPEIKNFLRGCPSKLQMTNKEEIEQLLVINQEPIGRIARSNPATYIKVFDEIRSFFSSLPESRSLGFDPGRFSFNVKEGSCSVCHGLGYTELPLDQGTSECITCSYCKGLGFDEQTLSVKFKKKNIADVLRMTVDEAVSFFSAFPRLYKPLIVLQQICLGYLKLGQPAPKLSGGEAQRIKLAKELIKRTNKKTLYILDEPTTGLHPSDIGALLKVLNQLIDQGHTVLIIEHNTHVLTQADWIVELGEGGGRKGGKIIFQGTPEEIKASGTPTGEALKTCILPGHKNIPSQDEPQTILFEGLSQNGLNISSVILQQHAITACYGPSGSGKHSFAVQTVYAEGQRHYLESLSPYLRQSIEQFPKPAIKNVQGLLPTVHISRKNTVQNPRSTIGTSTQIYDLIRVLYARLGTPYCPMTGKEISFMIPEKVILEMDVLPKGTRIEVVAPVKKLTNISLKERLRQLFREGFSQIILNGKRTEISYPLLDELTEKNCDVQLVIDRLKIENTSKERWLNAIEKATEITKNVLIIRLEEEHVRTFYLGFCVPDTGKIYPKILPKTFSFNHPDGQCPHCNGLGIKESVTVNDPFSKAHLSVRLWLESYLGTKDSLNPLIKEMCKKEKIQLGQLIHSLDETQKKWLWQGGKNHFLEKGKDISIRWNGLRCLFLKRKEKRKKSSTIAGEKTVCLSCHGSRLAPLGSHVLLKNIPIHDLCSRKISEIKQFLTTLDVQLLAKSKLPHLIKKIIHRLDLLIRIGVGHLPLSRIFHQTSLGERQRIRLTEQIGNSLTNILYVLEEPSLGLHTKDCDSIIPLLLELKSTENTLLMIEQNPAILQIADSILQFDQVEKGRTIVSICTPEKILTIKKKKEKIISVKPPPEEWIKCSLNEESLFQNKEIEIPCNRLTVLTGRSGSGKSTLLNRIFSFLKKSSERHSRKLILIDENPLSLMNRSDLLSFLKIGDHLRTLFAHTIQGKALALTPAHFNPNSQMGMCPACSGLGYSVLSLKFLPDTSICCTTCLGKRLNALSLEIEYKNKKYSDLFSLSICEVASLFKEDLKITSLCAQFQSLGLGRLLLGQEVSKLSRGELQRLKLFIHLSDVSEPSIFLIDDPVQSLHPTNVNSVLHFFASLIEKGHTLVCATHHEEFIKQAHWKIQLEISRKTHSSTFSVQTN